MVTPTNLSLWLHEQALPIGLILAFIVFAYILLMVSARRRRADLLAKRAGVTEATFAQQLAQFGFDPVIAAATYCYLQQVQKIGFPILASDSLDEDLGLDSEDISQTIVDLSAALEREYNPGLAHAPLVTVENLVRLLQASPRKQKISAA